MRYAVFILVFLAGLVLLGGSLIAMRQLHRLATTETIGSRADYAVVEIVGGDLLDQAVIDPSELASTVQMRILAIGLMGVVMLIGGCVFLFLTRKRKIPGSAGVEHAP